MQAAGSTAPRRETLELIQVFRGAAAIMVMLFHVGMTNQFYGQYARNAFGWGHSGIDFFFVLSGFIMLYVHYDQAGRPRRTWRFLALRAVRIYPIYWCVLAATVACFWLSPPVEGRLWAPHNTLDPDVLLRAFFLYRQDVDAVISVAWTLSFELVFYGFFALYILAGARVFAALALVWCGAILVQWSGVAYLGSHAVVLRPLIGEFFLGCLAAWLVKHFPLARPSAWWVVAAFGVVVVTARAELTGTIDGYTWWALPYFLLIWAGAAYDHATQRRYPRVLVLLGEASYTIYLIHMGLIAIFAGVMADHANRAIPNLAPNLTLTVLALAIVAIGVGVHLAIERPLLRAARRVLGRAPRDAPAP
jgi:peptidoglycan/LPS O-acetylase OafA/YrhL